MAIQVTTTDPRTGAPYPRAYARVEEAHVTLSTGYVDVAIALFYSADTAAAGKEPVFTYPTFTLEHDEINMPNPAFVQALADLVKAGKILSPRDALTACLYVLLRSRSEFKDAVDV